MGANNDFFSELDILDHNKSREDNLKALNERYDRIKKQFSATAKNEQSKIQNAQKIFSNEKLYQEYLEKRASQKNEAEAEKRRQEAEKQKLKRQLEQANQKVEELERLRADEAERLAQDQGEEHKPSLGETVVAGLAALAGAYLTAKQSNRHEVINLTGDWRSPDGSLHRIGQNGNQVRVQAINPFGIVVMDGTGTFDGRYLQASYQTAPAPTIYGYIATFGEAQCEVSDDGRNIRGQARNTLGQVFPINLYR